MNQPGGHHAHYHHQHEPTAGAAGAVVVQASGSTHADHAGGHDHGAMIADYRRRFWVTLVLTPPVLLLSPMIQHWLGLAETISLDRKSVVWGKSVSIRVDLGVRRVIKKKKEKPQKKTLN